MDALTTSSKTIHKSLRLFPEQAQPSGVDGFGACRWRAPALYGVRLVVDANDVRGDIAFGRCEYYRRLLRRCIEDRGIAILATILAQDIHRLSCTDTIHSHPAGQR